LMWRQNNYAKMNCEKLKYIFLVLILYSCKTKSSHLVNPVAKKLCDSAISIARKGGDYARTISLLDRATQIDSTYLTAYSYKLFFLRFIRPNNMDKILATLIKLNTLRPEFPDYYFEIGTIYLQRGDSVSSKKYLADAIIHYDMFIDTMHTTNAAYGPLLLYKSFALILQGQEKQGHDLLHQVYELETDTLFRKNITRMLQKSRQEVLDSLSNN